MDFNKRTTKLLTGNRHFNDTPPPSPPQKSATGTDQGMHCECVCS